MENMSPRAYTLRGVYHVRRHAGARLHVAPREHAALALRIKGGSRFRCGGDAFTAGDGSVIYIPSGVGYEIENADEEMIVVHLLCHGEDGRKIEISYPGETAHELLYELLLAWEAGGAGVYSRCMSLLYRILEVMELAQSAEEGTIPAAIAPGVRYLREHFREPTLSVSMLAERCHVSEVYFRRLYREHFGVSPKAAILDLRFDYARTLLRSGYYEVKEVAAMAGFADTKYFRTAFGTRCGCTPSQFMREGDQM